MSLQGNLSGFTLAEIFRMISFSKKTGNLVIARQGSEGRVYFRDGTVYFASTPDNRLPIGLRLVDAGMIAREHLEEALAAQKSDPDARLGEILVSRGLIAREALIGFVREQIQDALFEIFEWDDGTYYFEPANGTDEDIGLSLSVEEIVTEAEKRRHEWDDIREVLPSMDARIRLSTNAVALADMIQIDPQEWAAICQLAGGADLYGLRTGLHLTSLGLCRMIARMMRRGLLEVAWEQVEPPPALHVIANDEGLESSLTEHKAGPEAPAEEPYMADEEPVVEEIAAEASAADEPAEDAGGEPEHDSTESTGPVAAIRKYIMDVSDDPRASERRGGYPVEWLTYYGRLHHTRSKGASEEELRRRVCESAGSEKS